MYHRWFASAILFKVGVLVVVEAENALRPCNNVVAWGEYCVGPKDFVSASACMLIPAM